LLTTGLQPTSTLAAIAISEAATMLKDEPKFPARRTYVVKFRSDATLDSLSGRVENLVTCKQSEFASAHELCKLIARDFESCADEPTNGL
jgi:hypothetical protein